jgi:uncharacterized repeat protein (TIGR01451 family)
MGVCAALASLICVGLLGGAGSALAESEGFKYTGAEQEFKVPAGVTSVLVEARGSEGATQYSSPGTYTPAGGGTAALVSGELSVKPAEVLYVEVGGVPFNGGGSSLSGGAGGGASDVRTVSIGSEPSPGDAESLSSRLLVAAGGGGGGAPDFVEHKCPGGEGGNAEESGATGTDCGFRGGEGGGGAQTGKGGAGGAGYNEEAASSTYDGGAGELGVGGGSSFSGGGGGGGLYGGGAGGSQGQFKEIFFPKEVFSGGNGGGGGGSNLVPNGGTVERTKHEQQSGFVTLTWTATTADLSLANVALPNPVASGDRLTYTITATNSGGQTANEVKVKDQLPESVVFASMSTTQGACARTASAKPKTKGGLVTCNLGSIEAGKTATVTIRVAPTKKGTLTDKATVTASNVASDTDDEATATTAVLGK